jgi:hypothetical protein
VETVRADAEQVLVLFAVEEFGSVPRRCFGWFAPQRRCCRAFAREEDRRLSTNKKPTALVG